MSRLSLLTGTQSAVERVPSVRKKRPGHKERLALLRQALDEIEGDIAADAAEREHFERRAMAELRESAKQEAQARLAREIQESREEARIAREAAVASGETERQLRARIAALEEREAQARVPNPQPVVPGPAAGKAHLVITRQQTKDGLSFAQSASGTSPQGPVRIELIRADKAEYERLKRLAGDRKSEYWRSPELQRRFTELATAARHQLENPDMDLPWPVVGAVVHVGGEKAFSLSMTRNDRGQLTGIDTAPA